MNKSVLIKNIEDDIMELLSISELQPSHTKSKLLTIVARQRMYVAELEKQLRIEKVNKEVNK